MIIVRYLTRETLKSQLAVLFVLFLVFISQKFISILADATDGSIPSDLILTFMGLSIPSMALLMLPLSLYIGILLTFGRLYAESEITVMNATGMGKKLLLQSALALAVITGAIAAVNSFWVAPWSQEHIEQLKEETEAGPTLNMLVKGRFQQAPNGNGVIFIDNITDKGAKLHKVFVAQLKATDTLQPSVMVADNGTVKELSDGRQMLELNDGARYEGVPTQLNYSITHFNDYQALIGQREVKAGNRDWEAQPTMALIKDQSLAAKAELQWRFSLVLCIPLLVMIVVPLSAVNPRQGRFAKLAPAVLIYLAYFLAISSAKSAIEDGIIPSAIGMWPINITTLLVALALNSWDSMPVRRLKDKLRRRS
ncbi:lipopolysaccharide ABC transporter permease [Photobacterium angustum]|uniref:Lipopolysaccharide export system permease protein LptF n=1 Tax=Photobacterium angustum TaxID=661 RepID=A0ABX5H225_PHOAN|nr:LPS export ABC transporter permease LptF [Photobacterium angustum]KJG37440.1 lipopolysaccharide ABC transporter permease [Photobacterium angustum]PSX07808.1 LPS export ABC transporter permease LptF [Photobacterium angustum]